MSEVAGTSSGVHPMVHHTPSAHPVVQEAYSFACLRCGHGWEQSYDIEHHVDADGRAYVCYLADGLRVPSPLTHPTCLNCGGNVVRIMGSGRVSTALAGSQQQPGWRTPRQPRPDRAAIAAEVAAGTGATGGAGTDASAGAEPGAPSEPSEHHWHLSDLLHPFHRR
ncbi:hypothetical protein [Streptomyces sp. H27-D2]|uniref:hypothetical protein n=1 Tax=Streptomyces sp. H27-D2 TaxID=3046304 RepID=UPI002DBCD6CC|nr:hypothetical protein [Streptomyces sp. H27-D2]MEC4015224.1 hypothetical protein [Streptomyces sp. H27-D2]